MKLLALLFAVCALAVSALAAPATLKEVFAQEAEWKIDAKLYDDITLGRVQRQKMFTQDTAAGFLGRVASWRSDAERKHLPRVVAANRPALDPVLAAAEPLDAAKVKALRAALDRIAAAKAAAASDQAEVARVVAAMR
jgi:hypothetical protein